MGQWVNFVHTYITNFVMAVVSFTGRVSGRWMWRLFSGVRIQGENGESYWITWWIALQNGNLENLASKPSLKSKSGSWIWIQTLYWWLAIFIETSWSKSHGVQNLSRLVPELIPYMIPGFSRYMWSSDVSFHCQQNQIWVTWNDVLLLCCNYNFFTNYQSNGLKLCRLLWCGWFCCKLWCFQWICIGDLIVYPVIRCMI